MNWFKKSPLGIKVAVLALPLAVVGALAAAVSVSTYNKQKPAVVASVVSQSNPSFVLGDTTTYPPPSGTLPTSCPAGYTGTPPGCVPASGTYAPSGSTPTCVPPATGTYPNCQPVPMPTSCPAGYTGTPPGCVPVSGTSQPSTQPQTCPAGWSGTPPNCQASTGTPTPSGSNAQPSTCPAGWTGTPPNCQPVAGGNNYSPTGSPNGGQNPTGYQGTNPQAPPTFTPPNTNGCLSSVLGSNAAASFQSGNFQPTPDQIAKAQSCFAAQVNFGPPPAGNPGQGGNTNAGNFQGGQPFATIPIAPPAAFQTDSPTMACVKSIMGDKLGTPDPALEAQVNAKCFAGVTSGQMIGFIDPSGQNHGGPLPGIALANAGPNQPNGNAPQIPTEVKACVMKAGLTDADINGISHGQAPTAAQQSAGESCFQQYAKANGLTAPTLTPPDPSQPFNPNSKQNQCADVVAQTHGLRFNQINPGIVASWSADDVGKLRSCYGVAPASSANANGLPFAPTSPEVNVSQTKLTCIQTVLGADKLATVVAGTANISDSDRKAVYDKCINPTKLVNNNPALLGILAAMPPSDIEGQFIPIDSQTLPAPTASDANASSNGQVAVGGEVDVKDGQNLPTKVDVFVKSTPQIFTVALTKISSTRAKWTVNLAQNKLPKGNHEAYAVTTLADATQLRSPTAKFAIAAAKKATSHTAVIIEGAVAVVAGLAGGWYGWRLHKKHQHTAAKV